MQVLTLGITPTTARPRVKKSSIGQHGKLRPENVADYSRGAGPLKIGNPDSYSQRDNTRFLHLHGDAQSRCSWTVPIDRNRCLMNAVRTVQNAVPSPLAGCQDTDAGRIAAGQKTSCISILGFLSSDSETRLMNGVQKPCRVQYTCDGIESRDCGRSWRRRAFPNTHPKRSAGVCLQFGRPKSRPVSRRCWRSRWSACRKMVGTRVPPMNPPNRAELQAPAWGRQYSLRVSHRAYRAGKAAYAAPVANSQLSRLSVSLPHWKSSSGVALGSKLSFFPTKLALSSGPKTQKDGCPFSSPTRPHYFASQT